MQREQTAVRNGKRRNGHTNGKNGHRKVNKIQSSPISSKQEKDKKGKLDTITFIYGFGAAIVLVGAMFKFLGWSFANELFIVGLSIEAVVFMISAFERKEEEVEYHWENVFPQLQGGQNGTQLNGNAYSDAMEQFHSTLRGMTNEVRNLAESMRDIRESMQASSVSSKSMQDQMEDYIHLMDHYNENLRIINDKYDQVIDTP